MKHKIFVTDKSIEITEYLSSKYDLIKEYNSNIGYQFSNFILKKITDKDEKWNYTIPLSMANNLRKTIPRRSLKDIMDILYRENILFKYKGSYIIPDHENGIRGKATDYEIISEGFYDWNEISVRNIKNKFLIKNLDKREQIRLNNLNDSYRHVDSCLELLELNIDRINEFNHKDYIDVITYFQNYNKGNKDFYGRFHHKLSNFPKVLRDCTSFNGSCWYNIDMKTSQPLFLAMLLNKEYKSVDLKIFTDIILNKDIYSEFECLNHFQRDIRKPKMYFFLFGQNNDMVKSPIFREFKEKFPNVLNFIQAYKRKDHRELARKLQTMESDFIYNIVIKKLIEIDSKMPLLTIHDSIACMPEHKDLVKATMIIEFYKLYGCELKVGLEKYGLQKNGYK